ncbi:hypothetical protein [Frigoribacterium sp. Leaf172]|uniref:hypothetical protein n=1 Tax=Frigoribacterium sp. Leaf172 TaxID=1736285 RepID=UPI0006FC3A6E|nr:hypothetical protein [Frigoribacterium sp. Leaf172]KQR65767.1 hypothetical protein ASF89_00775 [Frigoribacterium sp. Leaf172]
MDQITMSVNGALYVLTPGQDLEQIKRDVAAAARDGADFATVSIFGNRTLSVLVAPGVQITLQSETVDIDHRSDEDLIAPFETSNFDDYHPWY